MVKSGLLYAAMAVCVLSLSFLAGCSEDDSSSTTTPETKAGIFTGDNLTFANGKARSWVKLDDSGNPVSLGVTFTEAVMSGLPTSATVTTMTMLMLPSQGSATAFDHVEIDWNPQGHPGSMVYELPHFDVHFYTVSMSDQAAIPEGADNTPVEARYVPADYVFGPPPAHSVKEMGVHYSDSTGSEFRGQAFDKTFIYGYSAGKMVFLEPMITKTFLETHPSFNSDIKLPTAYQKTGKYYPTSYSVRYDATTKEYTVSLDNLALR